MEEGDILDYWRMVQKRRKMIMTIFWVAVVSTGFISFMVLPRTYRAETTLIFPQAASSSSPLFSALSGALASFPLAGANLPSFGPDPATVYTGILKSRRVGAKMVRHFHLQKVYNTKSLGGAMAILRRNTTIDTTKEGFLSIKVDFAEPSRISKIVRIFRKPGWRIDARKMCADMANQYVPILGKVSNGLILRQSKTTRMFVERQSKIAEADLAKSQEKFRKFQEQNKTISLPDEVKADIDNRGTLEAERIESKVSLKNIEAELANTIQQVEEETKAPLTMVPASSSFAQEWRKQLVEAEKKLALDSKEYGPYHPTIIMDKRDIVEIRKQLREEIRRVLSALNKRIAPEVANIETRRVATEARISALNEVLDKYQSSFDKLPFKAMQQAKLQLDAKIRGDLYSMLKQQYEQAKIAEAQDSMAFEVLDDAVPPVGKFKPHTVRNMIIAGTFALFLGSLLAIFLGYWEDVRTKPSVGK